MVSLYTVGYLAQDQWLAYEDTQTARIYAYVPNFGWFVLHRQLGTLDLRWHSDLLNELAAEPDHRTVDEVFGA